MKEKIGVTIHVRTADAAFRIIVFVYRRFNAAGLQHRRRKGVGGCHVTRIFRPADSYCFTIATAL